MSLRDWFRQLLCLHIWDKTNSRRMMTQEMNTCIYCGKYEAGPDGWH